MRIAKDDVPVRINAPGAVARQQTDFGDATGFGAIITAKSFNSISCE